MFQILVYFIILINEFTRATQPRSVNVALETVLELNNKDDAYFIKTLQELLEKLKMAVPEHANNSEHNRMRNSEASEDKEVKFTKFLGEVVNVLKTYNDDDLIKFFRALTSEIRRNDSRFQQIADAIGFRSLVDVELKHLEDSPAEDIRRKLSAISEKLRFGEPRVNSNFVADFLNYYYRQQSQVKLSKFLNNIRLYRTRSRRTVNMDLNKIIRNGIKAVIDPILQLNANYDKTKELRNKHIPRDSESQGNSNLLDYIKKKLEQYISVIDTEVSVEADDDENSILDYIADRENAIKNHLNNNDHGNVARHSGEAVPHTIANGYKHGKKKAKRKSKSKGVKPDGMQRQHNSNKRKKSAIKSADDADIKRDGKNTSKVNSNRPRNLNLSDITEPILITIGSSGERDSDSDDGYVPTTRSTKQRRYKKYTRRSATKRELSSAIKRKQGRKTFETAAMSDEGMSIEHFGGEIKSLRKSADDKKPPQTTGNDKLHEPKHPRNNDTNLMRRHADASLNAGYSSDEVEEVANTAGPNPQDEPSDYSVLSEKIKVTGDIVFEVTAKARSGQVSKRSESSVSRRKSVYGIPKTTKLDATTSTRRYVVREVKPRVVSRTQQINETATVETSTDYNFASAVLLKSTDNETELSQDKNPDVPLSYDSELTHESENMVVKYNTSSSLPGEMENLKKSEKNDEDKKYDDIQKQMKFDLEKLTMQTSTSYSPSVVN